MPYIFIPFYFELLKLQIIIFYIFNNNIVFESKTMESFI